MRGILRVVPYDPGSQALGQVALSERQMKIIEFIHTHGSIRSGDIISLYGISRQAAGKELEKMVELNLIRIDGKGRATRYVMV